MSIVRRASETRWRIGRGLDPATVAHWIRGGDGAGTSAPGSAGTGAPGSGFALLVDERVRAAHRPWLDALAMELHPCRTVATVASGEASKSAAAWERLLGTLIGAGVRRHDTLVVIGGGVTGDLGGFVAATLHRGMRLVHVPTTLLAIADSSIGGKTGINHPLGKNLIGAFHPAAEIVVDTRLLFSLPVIEWINGFAEVVKYAYIEDPSMFDPAARVFEAFHLGSTPLDSTVQATVAPMGPDDGAGDGDEDGSAGDGDWDGSAGGVQGGTEGVAQQDLEHLIERSMTIKTSIVEEDEFEQGRRAILNFGHTFAHAIEQCAGYGTISHGSAVLIGMAAACHLSDPSTAGAATAPLLPFLRAIEPVIPSDLKHLRGPFDTDRLIESMKRDKKNRTDSIRFVLLERVGHAVVREVEDADRIRSAWAFAADLLNKPEV